MQQEGVWGSYSSLMKGCVGAGASKQRHQGEGTEDDRIAGGHGGKQALLHPTPALPAASPDSARLQQNSVFQLCRVRFPKTQPAHSRNCVGRSRPPAVHRDGATGTGDLAGFSAF